MSHSEFHDRQRDEMASAFHDERRAEIHDSWLDEGSADYWRHKRIYELISPIAETHRDSSWLTIGDGRFGLDSYRLKKIFGIASILPTDISEVTLKEGVRRNLISEFSVENAEELSFEDGAFDVIFCKESYHHLPRGVMGLYEMLRVARQAVVLIEPQWWRRQRLVVNPRKLLPKLIKDVVMRRTSDLSSLVSENQYSPNYEPSGNYIYTINHSEIEQIVRGIDLPGFAWKGFVDAHCEGAEFEPAVDGNPVFDKIRSQIEKQEHDLEGGSATAYPLAVAIIFKSEPPEDLLNRLGEAGFSVRLDTRNPVI